MKKQLIKWIFPLFMFTSCSTVAYLNTSDNPTNYPPTNANDIKIYSTSKIDKDYIVIGQVIADADAGQDADVSVNMLKNEAAKLGANAIVDLRLKIDDGYFSNAIKATGTAVRIK